MKRIVVIASVTRSLVNFRLDLLKALVDNGYEVFALGPNEDSVSIRILEEIGVKFEKYYLKRNGFNPIEDIRSISNLRSIFKRIKPDYILPYTVKPVVYSNMAKIGLPIVALNWITGVGFYGNESKGIKDGIVKFIITLQYRIGVRRNDVFIFQNTDDLSLFKAKGIVKKNKTYLTPGSGINLDRFPPSVPSSSRISFLFVARLIREKGLFIFIEAAKIIKNIYPQSEFVVVGGVDSKNPSSISQEEIDSLNALNIVTFAGEVNNVRDYLDNCSVFVLPSMYREGVPRSILEALSVGRAVITTDNVGCRETVVEGYNGILVEKNSVQSLVDALKYFCEHPSKIVEYGANSRQYASEKFEVSIVNQIILHAIERI